jgi:type IV pilus assembly protein PilQ
MARRRITNRVALGALVTTIALLGSPLFAQDSSPAVNTVEATEAGDITLISVGFDGSLEGANFSQFVDRQAGQIIVEVTGVSVGDLPKANGTGDVERVDIQPFGTDGVSLILTVTGDPSEYDVEVAKAGNALEIRVVPMANDDPLGAGGLASDDSQLEDQDDRGRRAGAVSGPQAQVSGLSSLDYENLDDVSRIVVGTTSELDYTVSQPEANMVVLDFPGADMPSSLGRVIDTSAFISPVGMVRAYSTRSGVRVAIRLTTDTTYTVTEGRDNLLYVDVVVPSEMQQDRALARSSGLSVAPSNPDTQGGGGGISGYSTSELYISESGATRDPQSAMGTGMGSGQDHLAGTAFGHMQDAGGGDMPYSGRRINIDLVDADIHSVFRLIAHVSRLNIVAGDDVSGNVTVRLEDVPWDQALAAILQSKGLGAQRFGNIVRIAPMETIKAEKQAEVDAQRAIEELRPLKILVVPLNYSQASQLSTQISGMISDRGSVEVDERSNQLIVKETEERLAQIRELLRHLDRQTPQVTIEARVVEANTNYTRSLGIQWGGELDASAATGYGTGLFFPSDIGVGGGSTGSLTGQPQGLLYAPDQDNLAVDLPADGSTTSLSFSLGSLPGLIDLDARLSAMEVEGEGEIISAPRVTTLDNVAATIRQGARIPFLSTSAGGTQVQFQTAALVLEVTPHITSDGKVFMDLAIENNRPDFGQAVQGQPALLIKEATTQLLVADGDTVVIGGVFSTEVSTSHARTPFLGSIPVLGALFRQTTRSQKRSEMLVFVSPTIVGRE